MIEFISQPWHWSISGVMIALVMFLLIYFGERFGVSSSFKAICSVGGAGRIADYFKYDWKKHDWLLTFVVGAIIGGAIGVTLFASPAPVEIAPTTLTDLEALGIDVPTNNTEGRGFIPHDLFNFQTLGTLKGGILMIIGGCTSGHAITGLSNLQLPSLVAVIGFFIGGLLTTFVLLPLILSL